MDAALSQVDRKPLSWHNDAGIERAVSIPSKN